MEDWPKITYQGQLSNIHGLGQISDRCENELLLFLTYNHSGVLCMHLVTETNVREDLYFQHSPVELPTAFKCCH